MKLMAKDASHVENSNMANMMGQEANGRYALLRRLGRVLSLEWKAKEQGECHHEAVVVLTNDFSGSDAWADEAVRLDSRRKENRATRNKHQIAE